MYAADEGELIQPLRGRPQPPTPLDGTPLDFNASEDRRDHLAQWLTSPANPYFSRAIANRIWANFFGVGLVELVAFFLGRSGGSPGMFANPSVEIASAWQALAILVVAGTLAGLIPAQRAVRINTVEALRSL